MAELLVLGSGPGFPVGGRAFSSALLQIGQHRLLIDAGEPCARSLWEQGEHPGRLDAILLTHGHSDHIGGLPMILQSAWIDHRKEALPIFLPGELIQPLTAWLNATYIGPEFASYALEMHAWEDDPTLDRFDLRVLAQPTTHLKSLRPNPSPDRFCAYSLLLEHPAFRILFSGDLGEPADLDSQLLTAPDLFVCELAHFPPKELFQYLSNKALPLLLLTHLAPELNSRLPEVLAEARRSLPGTNVLLAQDGMRIELNGGQNERL